MEIRDTLDIKKLVKQYILQAFIKNHTHKHIYRR